MSIGKILFGIFSAGISLFAENIIYGRFTKSKPAISKWKYIVLFVMFSVMTYCNNTYNVNETTFIIQILLMFLFNKYTYKDEMIVTALKTGIIFILIAIFEVVLTLFMIIGKFINLNDINENYYFKSVFSAIDLLLVYTNIVCFNSFYQKIYNMLLKGITKVISIVYIIFILIIGVIGYKITFDYSRIELYLSNIVLLFLFVIIVVMLVREILLRIKESEKQYALLDSMSKYEEFIDTQRINRHELLNHLVTLKSFKNKNSKDFAEALDELIRQNEKNELSGLNSLYNLPSGIKGMLYYKIHEMRSKGIEVFVNVDRRTVSTFDKLQSKYYVEICRMIGIFLDNASEAALKSKNKNVIIDVYKDTENLVIYIENTVKGKVNLEKLNEKNFSSKGEGRGLGLYVVKNIISSRDCYELIQEINTSKNFVTKLKINKEKTSK